MLSSSYVAAALSQAAPQAERSTAFAVLQTFGGRYSRTGNTPQVLVSPIKSTWHGGPICEACKATHAQSSLVICHHPTTSRVYDMLDVCRPAIHNSTKGSDCATLCISRGRQMQTLLNPGSRLRLCSRLHHLRGQTQQLPTSILSKQQPSSSTRYSSVRHPYTFVAVRFPNPMECTLPCGGPCTPVVRHPCTRICSTHALNPLGYMLLCRGCRAVGKRRTAG